MVARRPRRGNKQQHIGNMPRLQTLFLGNCFNIPYLPNTIVKLKSLVTMNLYNCGGLTTLPDNFDRLESLQVLSLQGCEKLVEIPESMADCPSLNTLTLWGCMVLEKIPDLTPLPKLQLDGVPEQLADWEAEQKKKRAEDLRDGKNKGPRKKGDEGPAKALDPARGTAASKASRALHRDALNAEPVKEPDQPKLPDASQDEEPTG